MVFRRQTLSAENEKLLNEFWDDKYAAKILADERSAKDDFLRAFKLIKDKSLYVASAKELTQELKKNCTSPNQHRRAADRLNEVLQFLKRDVRLAKPAEVYKKVRYLREEQVHKLAAKAQTEEMKWLIYTLFGTGARLGEALAIGPTDINDGAVYIDKQLMPDGTIKPPKRGKVGHAPIIKSVEKYVKKWAEVDDKNAYRDPVYDFIVENSKEFGRISPHDLRHSYAIHCLSKGLSLGMVANSLRNRIEVCQKYYTGYAHNTDTLDAAKKMLS